MPIPVPVPPQAAGPAIPSRALPDDGAEPASFDQPYGASPMPSDAMGEIVEAVRCPSGHLNPPYGEYCRVCQAPIPPQDIIQVPRPTLGYLHLSTGLVLALDRGAVLGRNPHPIEGVPGPQPNLVRLNDPRKDISSQHLEVRLDGWFVTVCDLNSTNGTTVILPGQLPFKLRPDEPVSIEPGTQVVLAEVFDFVFEVDQ